LNIDFARPLLPRTTSSRLPALLLTLLLPASLSASGAPLDTLSSELDVDGTGVIAMTCFPPPPLPGEEPGVGPPPPCLLPEDIGTEFISPDPIGRARVESLEDGTTEVLIELDGLAEDLVVTAWISYFFPGGPTYPDPIFEPTTPDGPAIADVSAPLAATTAAYTEGLGLEPNQLVELATGRQRLRVVLDYDPLLPNEGPLRNGLRNTDQYDAPVGSEAEQPLCCTPGLPDAIPQPVGSSLLRRFDPETGFQRLDEQGRPELIRSPIAVDFIAIVAHVDKATHGTNPGIPILPIPGTSVTTGDHFLLGMFDLRDLHAP